MVYSYVKIACRSLSKQNLYSTINVTGMTIGRSFLNLWVFVIVGLVSIWIASLTIGSQSLKAALANPVDALRSK